MGHILIFLLKWGDNGETRPGTAFHKAQILRGCRIIYAAVTD